MAAAIQVIQSPEAAAILFSPARMRILEQLAEPDSAAGVARRLKLPRQQVSYPRRARTRRWWGGAGRAPRGDMAGGGGGGPPPPPPRAPRGPWGSLGAPGNP